MLWFLTGITKNFPFTFSNPRRVNEVLTAYIQAYKIQFLTEHIPSVLHISAVYLPGFPSTTLCLQVNTFWAMLSVLRHI
jgi:hypothetical protein